MRMMMRLKLKIEPIPPSTWGISLSKLLPPEAWDVLRKDCYKRADYTCRVCGVNNEKMHSHEVWRYDDEKGVQRLKGLQCLCGMCHDVKHFGRSSVVYQEGYVKRLVQHWCSVNRKSRMDFNMHRRQVALVSRMRADISFQVKVGRKVLA